MNEKNIEVWEEIYSKGLSNLKYPNEMLVRQFNKYHANKNVKRVLDFGFGAGANLIHIAECGCEVFGVEVSDSAIDLVENKLKEKSLTASLTKVNNHELPYEDNYFDVVVAWQVLAYNNLKSFDDVMGEISRVLKPGGIFIGTMTAVGDISHTMSEKIGDYLYISKVPNQEGATCIIVDKHEVHQFFKNKEIEIGEYYFDLGGIKARHWVVTYEN